ncbi:hypothetical protein O181_122556 [Austropuccinia psidii MF-1]|uniref:Uncharacterized protein n=1 Tax=Austropuccinia psidii MF-1 TaxID=1389203 RepID=A0A9Q3KLR5_9BASI|nr:hypothetical protein [Austropuccinia psidii MF-1]
MVRQENNETASTVTSIIPASTVICDHTSTVIMAQNNQQEPISSELINLDISNTLQKAKHLGNRESYKPSSSSQKGHRRDCGRIQSDTEQQGSVKDFHSNKLSNSEADDLILHSKRAQIATRSLSGHLQSQPEGLQQCTTAQRVPYPCRFVEKLHELITDCKKIPRPSQHLPATQWMASIDGEEEFDAFNSRMEEKQPSTTKESAKTSPSSQQQQFQCEKAAKSSKQGQREGTRPKALQPGIQDSKDSADCHGKCISDVQNHDGITEEEGSHIKITEMIYDIFDSIPEQYEAINDIKNHLSDKHETIFNKIKTNNLSLFQINKTLMCFENVLREIKTSNNDNYFGYIINAQSAIFKELKHKYSKFNIDDIIETRIKQAISAIKEDNKKSLDDISKSFTKVKTHIIALKKRFDTSKEEISKLTIKLNEVMSDNTKQTELWNELTYKQDDHKNNVINSIQSLQYELRNSQRFNNNKMDNIY